MTAANRSLKQTLKILSIDCKASVVVNHGEGDGQGEEKEDEMSYNSEVAFPVAEKHRCHFIKQLVPVIENVLPALS